MEQEKKEERKLPLQFSKALLVQESILIWIITLAFIVLAFFAVLGGYIGSLPWLTALPTVAWAAYGVSQTMYYKKSQAENTQGGITFETAMQELFNNMDPAEVDPNGPI